MRKGKADAFPFTGSWCLFTALRARVWFVWGSATADTSKPAVELTGSDVTPAGLARKDPCTTVFRAAPAGRRQRSEYVAIETPT